MGWKDINDDASVTVEVVMGTSSVTVFLETACRAAPVFVALAEKLNVAETRVLMIDVGGHLIPLVLPDGSDNDPNGNRFEYGMVLSMIDAAIGNGVYIVSDDGVRHQVTGIDATLEHSNKQYRVFGDDGMPDGAQDLPAECLREEF